MTVTENLFHLLKKAKGIDDESYRHMMFIAITFQQMITRTGSSKHDSLLTPPFLGDRVKNFQ